MANETNQPGGGMGEVPDDEEALDQAELHRRAEEEAAEARSHRAGGEALEDPQKEEPHYEWTPPPELKDTTNRGILFRIVVFFLILGGGYYGLRWGTRYIFRPELRAVAPVLPGGPLAAGEMVTVGATLQNQTTTVGAAFVVAVLSDGVEVSGATVEVPGLDTAFASVDIQLDLGVNVISLVVFADGREVERLGSFPGLVLIAGDRQLGLELLGPPGQLARGDTMTIEFSSTNLGQVIETLVPRVLLEPEGGGSPTIFTGLLVELGPGESINLRTLIDATDLPPGNYSVAVQVVTPQGDILGRDRYPDLLEVTE